MTLEERLRLALESANKIRGIKAEEYGPPAPAPVDMNPPPAAPTAIDASVPQTGAGALMEGLPAIAKGSGEKASAESTSINKGSKGRQEQDWTDIEKALRAAGLVEDSPMTQKYEAAQRAAAQMLQEIYKDRPAPNYYAALASLVDYENARKGVRSNYAANAAAMDPNAEANARKAQIMAFADKDVDNARDMYKTKIGLLNSLKTVKTTEQQAWEQIAKMLAMRQDPSIGQNGRPQMPLESRAIRDVQKSYDKAVEPFNKARLYSDQIEALVNNTGPGQKLAAKTVETLLARARSEVGNLSQYEQVGTASAQDIWSRIEQGLSKMSTSEITPGNKQEILGLIKVFRASANASAQAYREKHAIEGEKAYNALGLTKDRFMEALPDVSGSAPAAPAAPNPNAPGVDLQAIMKNLEKAQKRLEELEKK